METINVYAYNTNIISTVYNRALVIYAPSKKEAVKMFRSFKMVKIGDRSGGKLKMSVQKVNLQITMLQSLIFQNKVYFNSEVKRVLQNDR